MPRIAYVNGAYVPLADAVLPIEDRATQFADAVYEVWAVRKGKMMDVQGHFARLERSLRELRIKAPFTMGTLHMILRETMRRNKLANGMVYLQISRGVAPRDHLFPANTKPSVVIIARPIDVAGANRRAETGIAVITSPDIRWGRVDIKTVGLLPNVLAKQAAKDAGVHDAILVNTDGIITECTSANLWIVDANGTLRTHPVTNSILNGITKRTVARLAQERQIAISETEFTVKDALEAREAFMTSANAFVTPITRIDGHSIGSGAPGPIALALRQAYIAEA
jgi:D-alanine transaminase